MVTTPLLRADAEALEAEAADYRRFTRAIKRLLPMNARLA